MVVSMNAHRYRRVSATPTFANLGDFAAYLSSQAQSVVGFLTSGQTSSAQNAYSAMNSAMPWGSYLTQLLPSTGGSQGSVITNALSDVTTQLQAINAAVFALGTVDPSTTSAAQAAAQQIISDASTITQQYQSATGTSSGSSGSSTTSDPSTAESSLASIVSDMQSQAQAISTATDVASMRGAYTALTTDVAAAQPLVGQLPSDQQPAFSGILSDIGQQVTAIGSVVYGSGTIASAQAAANTIGIDASALAQQIAVMQNPSLVPQSTGSPSYLPQPSQGTTPVNTPPDGTVPTPTLNLPPPPLPPPATTANPGGPLPPVGTSPSSTMVLPTQTITAPAPTTVSLPAVAAVGVGALGLGALLVWMMRAEVLNPVESRPRRRKRRSNPRRRR